MKQITFYFDVISPYAYLAFEQLPKALEGLSYSVRYRPVLFAAMLKHHGQLGPAEIAPKRDWTYRQVLWLAHTLGIDMAMPSTHPFNPLPLLRLAMACSPEAYPGAPNRYVCETIFRHVWRAGPASEAQGAGAARALEDPLDAERLQALTAQLMPLRDVQSEEVKTLLKTSTADAVARGVFGVPAVLVDGKLFWGFDALPMLSAYLRGDPWFGACWDSVDAVAAGVRRQ